MKKSSVVTLRLTPEERSSLEAARGSLTVSKYLRQLITGLVPHVEGAPPVIPKTRPRKPKRRPAKPRKPDQPTEPTQPNLSDTERQPVTTAPAKLASRCIICGSFPNHLTNCPRR